MKKIALLLVFILLAGTLSACFDQLPMLNDAPAQQEASPPPVASPAQGDDRPSQEEAPRAGFGFRLGEFEVVEDLSGLRLFDHDLSGSTLLEPIVFTNILGGESATVLSISGGEISTQLDGFLFIDAWAIELYYFARSHENASESVVQRAIEDYENGYFLSDTSLSVGPVRTSADHQTAFLVILETLPTGESRVCIYLAQNVPGTNEVIAMDITLYPDLWESYDDAILAELSSQLGVNLSAYLTGFGSV